MPPTPWLGPVGARLRIWSERRRAGSRAEVLAVLDGPRYLSLLKTLDALLEEPPLRPAAAGRRRRWCPKRVLKDYRRLARRVEAALAAPAGRERDEALHGARKAAKRTRYAAEAARPALGPPAKKFAKRIKRVQRLLGDHQDSVVARGALRELATQAHRPVRAASPSVCCTGARRPGGGPGTGAAGPVEEGLAACCRIVA